jgi:hypothetical protein
MVKGRLQPALNYIKEQPTYNRYELGGSDKKYNEVVTAPSVAKGTDFHVPSNEVLRTKADNK